MMLAAFVIVVGVVLGTGEVGAAVPTEPPEPVQGIDNGTSATVRASTSRDQHLFVGGNFSLAGGQPHHDAAAIDMRTGLVDHTWRVDTNGTVHAMVAAPDGSAIYVGGDFTTVNGVARRFVAKVHPVSGQLLPEQIDVNGAVYAMAAHRDRLYIGGSFSEVDGRPRRRLAALRNDEVMWSWLANANGRVRDINLSANGQNMFVAGSFNTLDGSAATGRVGRIRAADGVRLPLNIGFPNSHTVLDTTLSANESTLFMAVGGPPWLGGNRTRAVRVIDGALLWEYDHESDSQALIESGGVLYVGGHFDFADAGDGRARLMALNAATGGVIGWAPQVNSVFGVWDLDASPWGLVGVGDFTQVDGRARGHVAVYDQVTFSRPSTPTPTCRATVKANGDVVLRWEQWMGEETTIVRRDGDYLGRVENAGLAFADRKPSPGLHRYQVRTKEIGVVTDIECGTVNVPAPPVECRVTVRANGQVELRWDRWPGEDTYIVRRDGAFLTKVFDGGVAHTDTPGGPGAYDYVIRIKENRIQRDVPCGPVVVPEADSCVATVGGSGGVDITWNPWPGEDTYIVRRDGAFLAKVFDGGLAYSDGSAEPGSHSYLVRVKESGVVTNVPCGSVIVT
ncbi:MAG: hypothetical protein ACR2QE_12075 [Acidimicrobiales bacterium]